MLLLPRKVSESGKMGTRVFLLKMLLTFYAPYTFSGFIQVGTQVVRQVDRYVVRYVGSLVLRQVGRQVSTSVGQKLNQPCLWHAYLLQSKVCVRGQGRRKLTEMKPHNCKICQTNFVIALHALSLLLWHFITTIEVVF